MQTQATAADDWDDYYYDDFGPERVTMVDDGFERRAAFDGLWIHVSAQELRSGCVSAVISGVTVDLREAALSPEGATIHVQSMLSGIRFLVPPDWDVACDVDAICSGVSQDWHGSRSGEQRPRLRIVGMVVAGGLSVR
jgi:predicted membrane protein